MRLAVRSTAEISADGKYRYYLSRRWGSHSMVLWIMLNPSTADADTDDATIRKCRGFTQRWGFGSLAVVNLFAYRARNPKDLLTLDPVGPDNDYWIDQMIRYQSRSADPIIAAWGATPHPAKFGRVETVLDYAAIHKVNLLTLGRSRKGDPLHPLMQGYDRVVRSWL